MAFDFPASPTIGQVANGYAWDSEKWVSQSVPAINPNVPQSEQFFDLTGKNTLDITVPTWAKGAVLEGSVFVTVAANGVCFRISADGTTFIAGASDYSVAGPFWTSNAVYSSQAQNPQAWGVLTWNADVYTIPNNFSAQINLTGGTSQCIDVRSEFTQYVSGASGTRWGVIHTYVNYASWIPAVKALRLFTQGGANWSANSWVKVRWLGDTTITPPGVTNTIPDAPSDGAEYVRVNGVWRKKSETIVMDGLATKDVLVPSGAKLLRVEYVGDWATGTASSSVGWRGAVANTTTFLAGASDYQYVGMTHYSGTTGFAHLAAGAANYGPLTFASDNQNIHTKARALMPIFRGNAAWHWTAFVESNYYNSPAANQYTDFQFQSSLLSTNAGANMALQAIRFGNFSSAALFGPNSYLVCDWMY